MPKRYNYTDFPEQLWRTEIATGEQDGKYLFLEFFYTNVLCFWVSFPLHILPLDEIQNGGKALINTKAQFRQAE